MIERANGTYLVNSNSAVWRSLVAYKNLLFAIENLGIAVVYGISYYGKGFISDNRYDRHLKFPLSTFSLSINYPMNTFYCLRTFLLSKSHYQRVLLYL